jgi:hypothetical protein
MANLPKGENEIGLGRSRCFPCCYPKGICVRITQGDDAVGEGAQPQSPETRPYEPLATMAGRSGSAGRDITPEVGSRRTLSWVAGKPLPGNGCAASRPSMSASPQDTPTAKTPKSRSGLPSSIASTHSAPPKSFAWPDANGERWVACLRHYLCNNALTLPARMLRASVRMNGSLTFDKIHVKHLTIPTCRPQAAWDGLSQQLHIKDLSGSSGLPPRE